MSGKLDVSVHIVGAQSHDALADTLVKAAEAIRFGQIESEDDVLDMDEPTNDENPCVYFSVSPSESHSPVRAIISASDEPSANQVARNAGVLLFEEAAKLDGRKLVMIFFDGDRFAAGFADPATGIEAMASKLGISAGASDLRAYEPLDLILEV